MFTVEFGINSSIFGIGQACTSWHWRVVLLWLKCQKCIQIGLLKEETNLTKKKFLKGLLRKLV